MVNTDEVLAKMELVKVERGSELRVFSDWSFLNYFLLGHSSLTPHL